ncbi:MAG: UDP-N-acetyl-D-mannosamine dehydrogenase [Gammaproteobacteria bacterium]|nr:MAG: UDP-N-acetyl-D-mannosamine dehydrogenase [Gammaproteobacteria bacterium]
MQFKKINVVGLGYIGLPTAAVFANSGVKVHGVDVSQHVVDTISRGEVHIIEPNLDKIVHDVVSSGYLTASLAVEPADAFLIAVPTPFKDGYKPDLSYIQSAARMIAPALKKGDLVILESTSPVGATEQMAEWLATERTDLVLPQVNAEQPDIFIAHCPERVLPGKVLQELISNDRIIGGMTEKCSERATALYQTFVKGQCITTNARTAEMCKLTENSFRDVNIAFANELSMICDKLGINVWELITLANRHPRVNILQPGPGVGGHCIAVDPWFIVSKTPDEAQLIRTARQVNDEKPEWVINKVKLAIADYLQANPDKTAKEVTVACYGLAFKPDIDDLRESPARKIAIMITEFHVGNTLVVEPNITYCPTGFKKLATLEDAQKADIRILLVRHQEFLKQKWKGDFDLVF